MSPDTGIVADSYPVAFPEYSPFVDADVLAAIFEDMAAGPTT